MVVALDALVRVTVQVGMVMDATTRVTVTGVEVMVICPMSKCLVSKQPDSPVEKTQDEQFRQTRSGQVVDVEKQGDAQGFG